MESRDLVPFFGVSVSKVSGLGLEGFRSRALRLETLHRSFFMKFCKKEFLEKRFKKMIVQHLAVQRMFARWRKQFALYPN